MTDAEETEVFRIDVRLDAYKSFFDHDWAKKTLELAKGSAIDKAAFDLIASWKAIANTHRMPWAMMKFVDSFWSGFASEQSIPQKAVRAIHDRLCERVPGLSVTKHRLIRQEMQRIIDEVALSEGQKARAFCSNDLWNALITATPVNGFPLGIWGSQRLCYPAIYHFYENFLREVMVVKTGNPDYRLPRYERFLEDATKYLGLALVAFCLTDPEVDLVRLVRNAFAHKGGRFTKQLRELHERSPLPLAIDGDTLQIMPDDTKQVFNLLKDRVHRLVEAVVN